jgi:hypothetical protein
MPPRDTKLIAVSPAPELVAGPIRLYQDSWVGHIIVGHSDVDAEHIRETITDPCYIHESKTRPEDTFVFTSENCTNDDGDPMWVPVRKDRTTGHFVTTAYYKQNASPGPILWRRPNGK